MNALLNRRNSHIVVYLLAMLMGFSKASAQQFIVFTHDDSWSAAPLWSIDSIKVAQAPWLDVFMDGRKTTVKSVCTWWEDMVPDTLSLFFRNDHVVVHNPRMDLFSVDVNQADVTIRAASRQPFVCKAEGSSDDGRLIIDSDTTCTLVLDGLRLHSRKAGSISFPQKQKVRIELPEGTNSTLSDATEYQTDSTDTSNACLYARGSLTFVGSGALEVTGNYRHAIASGKNVTIEDVHLIINDAVKDGLHCDKLRMEGGLLSLTVTHDGAKGLKCKEDIIMTGGRIEGEAMGNVIIEDGETTYCSLLKSDGAMEVIQGDIILKHYGTGGRCISVDGDLTVSGGIFQLENHGHGGSYLTAIQDSDYYTPKCITVNGTTRIERGQLRLLATGNGGKGLDCSDTLFIGRNSEGFVIEDSLLIDVETRGTALVDNVDEDFRKGCPKAIKSDNDIYAYSGNLRIKTHGQGGEGIEAKGSLRAYTSTIIADCYDDGINTGQRCYIEGAHIYCLSHNNDGIDSNGKISIMNGIVAAISEHDVDESFDTNGGRLYIYGGTVVGIGHDDVVISNQSTVPFYSTPSYLQQDYYHHGDGINLQPNSFLTISKDSEAIVSLYHEQGMTDAFITVAAESMAPQETYSISDGSSPLNPEAEWFDGRVLTGGVVKDIMVLFTFKP